MIIKVPNSHKVLSFKIKYYVWCQQGRLGYPLGLDLIAGRYFRNCYRFFHSYSFWEQENACLVTVDSLEIVLQKICLEPLSMGTTCKINCTPPMPPSAMPSAAECTHEITNFELLLPQIQDSFSALCGHSADTRWTLGRYTWWALDEHSMGLVVYNIIALLTVDWWFFLSF